jgi:hypothetical protein
MQYLLSANPASPSTAGESEIVKAGVDLGAILILSDKEFADRLEAIAQDIDAFERTRRKMIMRIAKLVSEAHDLFLYRRNEGGFTGWMKTRFNCSSSNAYRLLDVHKTFGDGESFPNWETLPDSALYLLASRSVSQEARGEVAKRIEAGEKLSCADIQKTIKRAKSQINNGSNAKPIVVSEVEVEPKSEAEEEEKQPNLRDLWGKATPQERRDLFQVIGIDELLAVLPAHLRQGLEERLVCLRGPQRSSKLTKLLRTALKSRSPAVQITTLGQFNENLSNNNLDLEKVHVSVSK